MEAQIRQRLELQSAHQDHLILKERKREAEIIEEEEFRRQMMAKFAEDDRIEQMNAQKRRMKQLEHRRAVEKLMQERREEYQRQKVLIIDYILAITSSLTLNNMHQSFVIKTYPGIMHYFAQLHGVVFNIEAIV